MFGTIAALLSPLLNFEPVLRIRRNHGLEHGTVHVLNRQRYTLSGISSSTGFLIIGDVPTERVTKAVEEALKRFGKGEAALAVHPNCGTNLVTSGVLMTCIGALGFVGTTRRQAWERFSIVLFGMTLAAMYSLPLGMAIQKHFTTSGDMGDLELVHVGRYEFSLAGRQVVIHNVLTR
jgi:hypothetical protein